MFIFAWHRDPFAAFCHTPLHSIISLGTFSGLILMVISWWKLIRQILKVCLHAIWKICDAPEVVQTPQRSFYDLDVYFSFFCFLSDLVHLSAKFLVLCFSTHSYALKPLDAPKQAFWKEFYPIPMLGAECSLLSDYSVQPCQYCLQLTLRVNWAVSSETGPQLLPRKCFNWKIDSKLNLPQ